MTKRIPVNNELKIDWKQLFAAVNEKAIAELGEGNWTLMVHTANTTLITSGTMITNARERAILSLGLYLGAIYQKKVEELTEIPTLITEETVDEQQVSQPGE